MVEVCFDEYSEMIVYFSLLEGAAIEQFWTPSLRVNNCSVVIVRSAIWGLLHRLRS